mgnify:CR=1 FL=1
MVPLKKQHIPDVWCPYCHAKAVLRPASVVYGHRAYDPCAFLYVCSRYPECDAYVAAHRKSHYPMGTLADGALRSKRIEAHRAFNQLWESGLMEKWQAYQWLQAKFNLRSSDAHIAKFSEYMCAQLIAACEEFAKNNRRLAAYGTSGQKVA